MKFRGNEGGRFQDDSKGDSSASIEERGFNKGLTHHLTSQTQGTEPWFYAAEMRGQVRLWPGTIITNLLGGIS